MNDFKVIQKFFNIQRILQLHTRNVNVRRKDLSYHISRGLWEQKSSTVAVESAFDFGR